MKRPLAAGADALHCLTITAGRGTMIGIHDIMIGAEMMGTRTKLTGDEYDAFYWRHVVRFGGPNLKGIKRRHNQRVRRQARAAAWRAVADYRRGAKHGEY